MATRYTQFIVSLGAICALCITAACIPNPELPDDEKAPYVTGPFDIYFPNAKEQFVTRQVHSEETAARIKKKEAEHVPVKGELKIGLLSPKTGDLAKIGKDFQDAAMLALYDAQIGGPSGYQITLIPKDTEGSPSVALESAKRLLAQDTKVIIGPLFSQSTELINSTLSPPLMLSMSNNTEGATPKSFVFGVTPQEEMTRAVSYALKRGKSRVVALLPNNAYGQKLEAAIRKVVPSYGASLEAVEYYVTSPGGREAAAKRLAEHMRQLRIHVICFGDTKAHSAEMLQTLEASGMDTAHALKVGTSLWHDGLKAPKNLYGALYAATDQRNFNRFQKRFKSAYGRLPDRLAAPVYDAMTLMVNIASEGNIPDRTQLMAAEAVQGPATGLYQFEPNGLVIRGLALYQLNDNKYKVIENAPKSF